MKDKSDQGSLPACGGAKVAFWGYRSICRVRRRERAHFAIPITPFTQHRYTRSSCTDETTRSPATALLFSSAYIMHGIH